jgi:hypothetical protein
MSIFGDTPVGFVSFILLSPPSMNTTKIEEIYQGHISKPQHRPWKAMVEPYKKDRRLFQCKFCKYFAGEKKIKKHLDTNHMAGRDAHHGRHVGKGTSSSISFAALKEFTLKMKAEQSPAGAEEIFSAFEKN